MGRPIDVPTRETVTFVTSHLPASADVLEVGCGEGHVAAELLQRGHRVIGVDSDENVIARAQRRGVRAIRASWPDLTSEPVDAVVFTRSLHHIDSLDRSIGRAREVLRPTGALLVEDFAFDEADEPTISWFLKALGSESGKRLIEPVPDEFVTDLLGAGDPACVWHQSHDHELHTITAMTRAIAEQFAVREIQPVPYLYRYLVPVLPDTSEAAAFVEEILREETRLGERGVGVLIGRRIVGSRCPT